MHTGTSMFQGQDSHAFIIIVVVVVVMFLVMLRGCARVQQAADLADTGAASVGAWMRCM